MDNATILSLFTAIVGAIAVQPNIDTFLFAEKLREAGAGQARFGLDDAQMMLEELAAVAARSEKFKPQAS